MTITRLLAHAIEKPWGRVDVPGHLVSVGAHRIGEVWFCPEQEKSLPLLVKYIFTSEKLSVQVHPDDSQAQARGLAGGKSECWYVLDAQPDARLGIGLTCDLTPQELRSAALDGRIEELMDWKPVRTGSFYYVPAGTVHSIGGGVTLVEIQQNNDVTYRLYDYGRPRELHLEEAVAVSITSSPYSLPDRVVPMMAAERLVAGPGTPFLLDMVQARSGTQQQMKGEMLWFVPLAGYGMIEDQPWRQGECWLIEGSATLAATTDMSALLARLP